MKKQLITLCCGVLMLAACHSAKEPSHDELAATIDSIETSLLDATRLESVDTAEGNNIIRLYTKFADTYPDDTLTAKYLHNAAKVACGMDRIDEMTEFYDRVIDNYPDYSQLAECYYEKGIALDNAGRKEEARQAYQEFLENYPDHFLANDIRMALPLLDLSDEMLIKHLQSIEH